MDRVQAGTGRWVQNQLAADRSGIETALAVTPRGAMARFAVGAIAVVTVMAMMCRRPGRVRRSTPPRPSVELDHLIVDVDTSSPDIETAPTAELAAKVRRDTSAPDVRLGRPSRTTTQQCRREARPPDLAAIRDLLLSRELKQFGTSANAQEIHVVELVHSLQRDLQACGPLVEIGVYKGWFVAVLASFAARPRETVYAIDLFDDQAANVDNSGGGRQHKPLVRYFWNIIRRVNASDRVRTIQGNSLVLESGQLMDVIDHNPRIFSVDGAHFGMAAFRDLVLASSVLHPKGVIALDDYQNAGLPGVIAAFATYMAIFPTDLAPFLASRAKLYLCKAEMYDVYFTAAVKRFPSGKTCPVSALNAKPDHRVAWNASGLRPIVDIASKRGDNTPLWC